MNTDICIVYPHHTVSTAVVSADEIVDVIPVMQAMLASKPSGVALHHSQVETRDPKSFFILRKELIAVADDKFHAVVNPRIVERDKESDMLMHEGCLSWPFRKGIKKRRCNRVKVEFDFIDNDLNIPGKHLLRHVEAQWVEGLIAQIFQHECDHGHGMHIYN